MKKLLNIIFCSLLIVSVIYTPYTYAQSAKQYVKVDVENLRDKPSGNQIGTVNAGSELQVIEKRANWVKVQFTGWIWENSLTSDSTYVVGFSARASHIVLKTEADAKKVLAKLSQGQNFEELAETFSIDRASGKKGGDLGTFQRGDLLPEFEETVLKLKTGEISKIIETPLGFHIIKRTK